MQFFVGGKLSFKNEERSTDVQDIFPYIVIKRMGETRFDSCHPLKMRCQGWLCLVGSFLGGFVALILDLDRRNILQRHSYPHTTWQDSKDEMFCEGTFIRWGSVGWPGGALRETDMRRREGGLVGVGKAGRR